ncbi:hypothetical protein QQZ08_011762 [Neonectria magnoliae]|uniref:non-specific serine/threonine protein kinase n=1 Tax=Neonectria magnoliae TaxID=2732573 RepID=A0ABR1H7K5_9HYPO
MNQDDKVKVFALKRFRDRPTRDDYENEKYVLKALAAIPHRHSVCFLSAWVGPDAQCILFPLAAGDLRGFLESGSPPSSPEPWVFEQMLAEDQLAKRVGFHHDLKPANILLFMGASDTSATWKICDFGSDAVEYLASDSSEDVYNRKASTGDPVYSAPEYIVDGKVFRPKDVWSLGCIFLEVFT